MKTTLITIAALGLAGLATASASGRGTVASASLRHHQQAQERNAAAAARTPASGERTTFALSAKQEQRRVSPRYFGTSLPRAHR